MSVPTVTILADGQPIPPEWPLLSLSVSRELNRIPTASLAFVDETQLDAAGPVKKSPFGISSAGAFVPGAKIEIKLRYEDQAGDETTVFAGVVVRHGIEADARGCRLHVEMKDAAVALTGQRRWRVFANSKDSDVVQKLAQEAHLQSEVVTTEVVYPELVQYDSTDWDFAVARAEANGLVLTATDGQLALRKIEPDGAAKYSFDYDLGAVYELEMQLDAAGQPPAVQGFAWDPATQAAVGPVAGADFALQQSDVDGGQAGGAVGLGDRTLFHPVPMERGELQAWADGQVMRSRLAFLRGRLATPGVGDIALLDVIELLNVGDRFAGQTLVTGLRHTVEGGDWRTDIQFGLSPRRLSEQPDFQPPPAAGLLPSAGGLQTGIVQKIDDDPAKLFRVQVRLPALDADSGVIWARWASPQAANGYGCFFLPDVGDEVVVGFLDGDPRHPVVLGALFSSKNTPPAPYDKPDAANVNKGFVSRKGVKFSFVDADSPSVCIETPGGGKLLFDDDAKSVTLTDQNQNTITLGKDGIAVKSAKDLKLEATGNVVIKGAKVDVQ